MSSKTPTHYTHTIVTLKNNQNFPNLDREPSLEKKLPSRRLG